MQLNASYITVQVAIPTTGANNLNSGSGVPVSQDSMNFYSITYQMAFTSLLLVGDQYSGICNLNSQVLVPQYSTSVVLG